MTLSPYTVIRFVSVSAKFGTCTVVRVNGTLVEAKMCTFTLESTHFIFNKCPIYTHGSASAKFSTNSHETDYSVCFLAHLGEPGAAVSCRGWLWDRQECGRWRGRGEGAGAAPCGPAPARHTRSLTRTAARRRSTTWKRSSWVMTGRDKERFWSIFSLANPSTEAYCTVHL